MDDVLTQIPLFRALSQTEFKHLASTCEVRRFRKGDTIFAMTPAELLCGISAFEHGAYSATAIASTDTQLVKIPAEAFSRLLDRSPQLARQVVAICCRRLRRMAEAISVSQAPVEQRMAYMLLRLQRSFGNTIPVTHQELAGMMGARWETSIRMLSAMKRSGWVASSRGRIMVLAPRKLRALLNRESSASTSTNGHDAPPR